MAKVFTYVMFVSFCGPRARNKHVDDLKSGDVVRFDEQSVGVTRDAVEMGEV